MAARGYYHDRYDGKIHIILEDCRDERANKNYRPAMTQNAAAKANRENPVTRKQEKNEGYTRQQIMDMMRHGH